MHSLNEVLARLAAAGDRYPRRLRANWYDAEVVTGWDGFQYLRFNDSCDAQNYCEALGLDVAQWHCNGFENGILLG